MIRSVTRNRSTQPDEEAEELVKDTEESATFRPIPKVEEDNFKVEEISSTVYVKGQEEEEEDNDDLDDVSSSLMSPARASDHSCAFEEDDGESRSEEVTKLHVVDTAAEAFPAVSLVTHNNIPEDIPANKIAKSNADMVGYSEIVATMCTPIPGTTTSTTSTTSEQASSSEECMIMPPGMGICPVVVAEASSKDFENATKPVVNLTTRTIEETFDTQQEVPPPAMSGTTSSSPTPTTSEAPRRTTTTSSIPTSTTSYRIIVNSSKADKKGESKSEDRDSSPPPISTTTSGLKLDSSPPPHSEFTCVFCEAKRKRRDDLDRHIRTHTRERPVFCQVCGMEKAHGADLSRHLRKFHTVSSTAAVATTIFTDRLAAAPSSTNENKAVSTTSKSSFAELPVFRCSEVRCKGRFLTLGALEEHSKHHGSFKCVACDVVEGFSVDLALHEMEHVEGEVPPPVPHGSKNLMFSCLRCEFSTGVKAEYLRHHSEAHLQLPRASWSCPICGVIINTKHNQYGVNMRNAREHFKGFHDVSGEMDPEDVIKCNQCPAYFRRLYQLDYHTKDVHNSTSMFSCVDCKKEFRNRKGLRDHRNNKHPDATDWKFVCPEEHCGNRYETFSELKIHRAHMHRVERVKVACPTCGEMVWKNKLRFHMNSHRKKKELTKPRQLAICDQCGVSFKNNVVLKRHQLSHAGPSGWGYSCPICGKKCPSKLTLEAHLRTHTKEKPFICQVCGEAYAHRHNLRAHVNRVHADVIEDKPIRTVVRRKISSKKGVKVKHLFDTSVKL